jgi:hypothetical protein
MGEGQRVTTDGNWAVQYVNMKQNAEVSNNRKLVTPRPRKELLFPAKKLSIAIFCFFQNSRSGTLP